jgi:hypothetical protein
MERSPPALCASGEICLAGTRATLIYSSEIRHKFSKPKPTGSGDPAHQNWRPRAIQHRRRNYPYSLLDIYLQVLHRAPSRLLCPIGSLTLSTWVKLIIFHVDSYNCCRRCMPQRGIILLFRDQLVLSPCKSHHRHPYRR